MVISKNILFHKVHNVERMWINYPQCGKSGKMWINALQQSVFHKLSTSENRITKPFYEFSTLFHIC